MARKASRASKAPKADLLVTLDFNTKRAFKATDKQTLKFSLTNESTRPLKVLKWHTPLEGVKSDMFRVDIAGHRATYLGPIYKRMPPSEADYITIRPGATVTAPVDLASAYDIALPGNYNVKYKTEHLHAGVEPPKALTAKLMKGQHSPTVTVRSNTAIFTLARARRPKTVAGVEVAQARKLASTLAKAEKTSFSGCSQSRQTDLNAALTNAVQIAATARSALANASSCARATAPRYREWFGKYSQSRFDAVKSHFDKIHDALANKDITFFCDCSDAGTYAYVYPTKPYEIHLCGAFWNALMTGTDSKAGTLVHETSHFNVVASTDDHVYGQSACRTLANNNPGNAIDNADSHEYFAENTPSLSMSGQPGSIVKVTDFWRNMPSGFAGSFDAALNGGGPFAGKCYFFKGDKYIRYDWSSDRADSGYPKNIAANWHDLPAGFKSNFDAAINGQGPFSGKCYFFKGDKYIRYDWGSDRCDPGYPKSIDANWHNLPAGFKSNFDAAINGGGPFAGKCYIFKGDSYIRYDWQTDRTDPGYPKKTADFWSCMPSGFTGDFEAALEGDAQFSGRGYFFKGNNYIRYSWAEDRAE
jgi:peptidyl-Lys metalloendopeptidase